MVVHARRTNLCHQRPPYTALCTAAACTGIDLTPLDDDEVPRLQHGGLLGQGAMPSPDAHCSGSDICDGFFHFSIPELSSWCGIDEAFGPTELGVSETFDEELGRTRAIRLAERVHCCLKAMPMGWTSALLRTHCV